MYTNDYTNKIVDCWSTSLLTTLEEWLSEVGVKFAVFLQIKKEIEEWKENSEPQETPLMLIMLLER